MLTIFFGTDEVTVRSEARAAANRVVSENSFSLHQIDAETYEPGQLASVIGATSLFGGGCVYILDTPSLSDDFYEELVNLASVLATSSDNFIVIERTLLVSEKKKFLPPAALVEYKKDSQSNFEPFSLAEALATKDKRQLWLRLTEALTSGMSPEEIIGILWWQIKLLNLAAVTKTATEAGVKDYPYNKAKRALGGFKVSELEKLTHSLLALYHDGHSGKRDITLALERWVLEL